MMEIIGTGPIILFALIMIAIGLTIGKHLEAWHWRSNAKVYTRIESAGALYKVTRDG